MPMIEPVTIVLSWQITSCSLYDCRGNLPGFLNKDQVLSGFLKAEWTIARALRARGRLPASSVRIRLPASNSYRAIVMYYNLITKSAVIDTFSLMAYGVFWS